jgi:hypothetical protein
LSCPFFDHQEAVDKRWDRHSDEARRDDEQFIDALIPAAGDSLCDEGDCFHERTLAAGPKFSYACHNLQLIGHLHGVSWYPGAGVEVRPIGCTNLRSVWPQRILR